MTNRPLKKYENEAIEADSPQLYSCMHSIVHSYGGGWRLGGVDNVFTVKYKLASN